MKNIKRFETVSAYKAYMEDTEDNVLAYITEIDKCVCDAIEPCSNLKLLATLTFSGTNDIESLELSSTKTIDSLEYIIKLDGVDITSQFIRMQYTTGDNNSIFEYDGDTISSGEHILKIYGETSVLDLEIVVWKVNAQQYVITENVTEIHNETSIGSATVILPNTLTYIGEDVFRVCEITYDGTYADLEDICEGIRDSGGTNTVHFNDGTTKTNVMFKFIPL